MMRGILLCTLFLLPGCAGDHPDASYAKPKTYSLGVITFGQLTYGMRADSADYARIDTIRIERMRLVPEFDSIRNRLGTPEYWVFSQGKKHWKFSAEDLLLNRVPPIYVGRVYRIEYGYRDVWYAVNGIWNLQNVKEIGRTQAPE